MQVVSSPLDVLNKVREARRQSAIVGVVPTMGALHEGHVSLIERARQECGYVVVTIFVNPTQFGPHEDFSRYPRTLDVDLERCRAAGTDVVFTPEVADMYAADAQTRVCVCRVTAPLEGEHRPGHFDGVSTIVCKLFQITQPDRAYFGQKDYQQQLVIRQMVRDLDIPVEICTCATVRETDGLALSSRNRYLNADERSRALQIFQALKLAESLAAETFLDPQQISERMQQHLQSVGGVQVEYAMLCSRRTLQPLTDRNEPAVALIAVKIGTTRLIDNLEIDFQ